MGSGKWEVGRIRVRWTDSGRFLGILIGEMEAGSWDSPTGGDFDHDYSLVTVIIIIIMGSLVLGLDPLGSGEVGTLIEIANWDC